MSDSRLHRDMLIAFVLGIGAGVAANLWAADAGWLQAVTTYVTQPVGQLFLNLLRMLVVPLVFSALMLGVVEIGDPKSLGRIGGKTLLYIALVTAAAVSIGLLLVNLLQPGSGLPPEVAQQLLSSGASQAGEIAAKREGLSGVDLLLKIVPANPIAAAASGDLIAVMFFALLFGVAATVARSDGTRALVGAVQGIYEICLTLIGWVIRMAPYAVFALLFTLTAKLGYDVLLQLARFVGTVVLALAIHMFVVFPLLLRGFGGVSPLWFFRQAEPAMLTAFSTSSSSATLPTTLKVSEENLRVPHRIGRFVCTLGATANMNGTALFEGITVLFLAQFFGIELSLLQQVMVLAMCILGGIGAAGVPGGSLPVIVMILAMFGIPPEGIALVLGVDRFLDMCRTCVNVTGDLVGAVVIGRSERGHDHDHDAELIP
ncbi:MAG TPA: dicarboxylate/amino acid:cation symporter [Arenimonas sp.]|nr:dicarboxylate/amino acid:cation symporter [Arenimonas sp.]